MSPRVLLPAVLLLGATATASAQSVSLTLHDGRVTLITQNATPAAILAEWARQGQMRVVDAERIPGAPLTLRLENVGEREALDIVLRGAAGYVAAPRAQATAGQSRFDRLIVMATSPGATLARATAARAMPAAPTQPAGPAQMEEQTAPGQQVAVVQDEVPPAPANGAEQPASSTNFDYANPQRYFAARQAAEQAASGEAPATTGAETPATTPGPFGATRSTPGVLPMPPAAPNQPGGTTGAGPVNPYGLPPNQSPGSSQGTPPLEPDRSKYINPYSPTPPTPPGSD